MKRIVLACLVAALLAVSVAGPASAATRVKYEKGDATLVYSRAGYLGQTPGPFMAGSVEVQHFLIGIGGYLDTGGNPTFGCRNGFGATIDKTQVPSGPYLIDVASVPADSLAIVKRFYCVNDVQALKISAAGLIFLTGVDATAKGRAIRTVTPPAPGPAVTDVTLRNGVLRVGTDVTPGTYRAITMENCEVIRKDGSGRPIANNYFPAGEQIVVTVASSDGFLDVQGPGSCPTSWQRIDLTRLDDIDPLQPGVIPTGNGIVGVDVDPGIYRSTAASSTCNLFTTKDFSLDLIKPAIGTLGLIEEGQQVIIEIPSDAKNFVFGPECGTFERYDLQSPIRGVPAGVSRNGADYRGGSTLSGRATGECYVSLLNNFLFSATRGSFADTESFTNGQAISVRTANFIGVRTLGACGTLTAS